jgi:hypothetical protein
MSTLALKRDMKNEIKKLDNPDDVLKVREIIKTFRHIPTNYSYLECKDIKGTIYTFDDADNKRFVLKAYRGLNLKPAMHYRYSSKERRDTAAMDWYKHELEQLTYKKKTTQARTLAVDDVLYTSWGHDQTNINFYQITKLVGKMSVVIQEISSEVIIGDIAMTGKKCPLIGDFCGEPMTKRVAHGDCVNINSSERAHPLGFDIVGNNIKTYHGKSWTAYA